MKKQRRSTQLRETRKATAERKRLSLQFQQPGKLDGPHPRTELRKT